MPTCNKKVVATDDKTYRCEKCNQIFDSFKMVYILQAEIADFTGSIWATLFGSVAEKLVGRDATELAKVKEVNGVS